MSWSIFMWAVVPPGTGLVAMLASGQSLAMWLGSKVLSTPVNMANMQLSLGSVMTAVCMIVAGLSYSAMQRAEARAAVPSTLRDAQLRDVFFHGRNLYMALLGLALWATAWRLKALYDSKMLGMPAQARTAVRKSPVARGFYLVLGCTALLLADIPICRVNYNLMLSHSVTPKKLILLETSASACEGFMLRNAGGKCADFCQDVRQLAEERLAAIKWARNWHILGRVAAEMFDGKRGVEQGEDRIDTLFEKKSCAQVLRSVDKSNQMVNVFCYLCAVVSVMGAFSAFANVLTEHRERDNKED